MADQTLQSEGPWRLSPDADLAPGDSVVFDLHTMAYRGRKGYFKPKLPLDQAQVTNQDGANTLLATFNGVYEDVVVPNAVESFEQAGITRVVLTNTGGSTIAKSDITVVLAKAAYGADEAAREKERKGIGERALTALTGGVL